MLKNNSIALVREMRHWVAMRFSVAVLLLFTSSGATALRAEPRPDDETSRRAVEQLLAPYRTPNGPGCAVGVLRDRRVVLEAAAGTADGIRPLTSNTPIYLASVSKQFTAAAIYRLAAMRKIQ